MELRSANRENHPNSNPDIVINDHENMSMYIKRCFKYGRQKCGQERSRDDSKI